MQVIYDGVDITADLEPHILSWTYTDNISDNIDDLQIALEDRAQLWSGDWMPEEGAKLSAKIIVENWGQDEGLEELPLGQFEIDELETGGPPSTATIKALSLSESTSLRGEKKNKAWEKTKLSVIARDLASSAGLELFFETEDNPEYDRVEQTEETDLSYLSRLCSDAGLCLKISDAQLVIFDIQKYEAADPIAYIKRDEGTVKLYQCRRALTGLYRACRLQYDNAKNGKTIKYTFEAPNPPKTDKILVINERVSSVKEAERLAKKRLREANQKAVSVSVTVIGNIGFYAGATITLQSFGKFDGKYIIKQVTHSQGSGFETKLELNQVLEGY